VEKSNRKTTSILNAGKSRIPKNSTGVGGKTNGTLAINIKM
jgi:hypothetical protein